MTFDSNRLESSVKNVGRCKICPLPAVLADVFGYLSNSLADIYARKWEIPKQVALPDSFASLSHNDLAVELTVNRQAVLAAAYAKHPERFVKG